MDLGIKNKKALVLGSSKGLGLGIAKALLKEGVQVAILGRHEDTLKTLAANLSQEFQSLVVPVVADLSDDNCETIIFDTVQEQLGDIDILVNNTGGPPMLNTLEITTEQWQKYLNIMFIRLVSITQHFLPAMLAQGYGRIINIASSGVIEPLHRLALSNACRSALLAWSKTLATEIAARGVTINTVVPGKIDTDRMAELQAAAASSTGRDVENLKADAIASIPLHRYGQVEEFGAAAAFLASLQASYITGSCLRVDGGMIKSV